MEKRRNIGTARGLRRNMTDAEHALWRILRSRQLEGFKFRRQHSIGRYVVDFVCLERKVVIEVDGGHHVERAEADSERTKYLESEGFRVIRFWNNEVLAEMEGVAMQVLATLTPTPLPPAGEGL
jgi:adenine-specific DNA-methyltransferase